MVPPEIVDFIYSSHAGAIGSRDENLVPIVRRCVGTDINDTKAIVMVYVVQSQHKQMLKNFNDNGRVSLILVEWPSHRSYQFKGQFLRAREMTADEAVFQQQFREKYMSIGREAGYPDELVERFVYQADLAIEFKVEKIFNQTPGPGAGKAVELANEGG